MTFDAIGIAGTGLTVHRKWLDAISDNIANINTATSTDGAAFRARYILAQTSDQSPGVYVAGTVQGDAEGRVPASRSWGSGLGVGAGGRAGAPPLPLADADGYVRYPDIDLGDQMSQLILAQRGYQASAAIVDRARTSYEAALQIGRNA